MKKNVFLLRLLNVRPNEWKVVSQLFWLQFFMGTGIAFFFTASFSHFLEKFSASELAWVMIISAPILFVTGFLFSKFEHRFHLASVGAVVIVLMALSILVFQLLSTRVEGDWIYYLTFAWYYVLYLASNLCFWSITSELFDVRQSKRLFAVISGGDIPAKFIGYTMAYFFVKTIGPLNMLWPAFLFMLGSLPFLYQISKSGVIHHHQHHKEHAVEYVAGKGIKVFIKRYTLNTLIRRLAVLTFIISACLAIITYAFYTKVKEENHNDKELSNFIILFMAASQIVALLVKIVFTGRIVTSFGIKKSLLITPIVLLFLLALILGTQYTVGEGKLVFYAFGIAAIAIEVLRTAITNPVFLTVMQPLDHNARAKAHSIVKGIMDPFAFLITGFLLIIINMLSSEYELTIICYILAFFSIAWIISINMVNNSYHNTLVKAISSRFFSQDEFTLSDDEIQNQVIKKIETGDEEEVINVLQMLNTKISDKSKALIFKLLDHSSDNIKKATIQLIQNRDLKGAEEKLKHLADHSINKEVQKLAVESLCKEQNEHHHQKHYLHHHDPELKAAALRGMILSAEKESRTEAESLISDLINSNSKADRFSAIEILENVKNRYSHPQQHVLFKLEPDVRKAAFKTIGTAANKKLLETAIVYLAENPWQVAEALHAAEESSIPVITEALDKHDYKYGSKEKLITTLGKIGGKKSQLELIRLLNTNPSYAMAIAKALHRSRYKATQETQKRLEEFSLAFLVYGAELLYMQNKLESDKKNFSILSRSLNIELTEIRNTLICFFGCLYDHEKAFKIKQGLDMKKKETIANSMELIEMMVIKDLAMPFNKLYEPTDLEERCNSLRALLPEDKVSEVKDIISKILSEKPIYYTVWTKACSMYVSKKTDTRIQPEYLAKYFNSGNQLLRETALFAR